MCAVGRVPSGRPPPCAALVPKELAVILIEPLRQAERRGRQAQPAELAVHQHVALAVAQRVVTTAVRGRREVAHSRRGAVGRARAWVAVG
jgi:hypothetical protein